MPKGLKHPWLLLCAMPGLTDCAGATPIVMSPAVACAALLPAGWKAGVAGSPLPIGETVGEWIAFADAQTGKLDEANGRTRDAIAIVERCEGRSADEIKRARRGWWKRLVG